MSQPTPLFYHVHVPEGIGPGMPFYAQLGSGLMLVTCPPGASAGTLIQVQGTFLTLHLCSLFFFLQMCLVSPAVRAPCVLRSLLLLCLFVPAVRA